MSKFFKFEKEVAQNIGLVKSILYQFIKEQKEKINLNEIVEEFSFLSQDETRQFKNYFREPNAGYSRRQRREVLRSYLQYMKIHIEYFGEVKSLDVLQVLFD